MGPGPDTRHWHQRHTSRDDTPTTSPSGEGPPSSPGPSGTVETAPTRDTALCARDDNLPPPAYRQRPTHAGGLVHSPRARALLRSGRHSNVPGPQRVVKGTDTMPAPGAAPPDAKGDPTTPHKVLRGVLQPGDQAPARTLAQISSGRDRPSSACPSGSSASCRPQRRCPGSAPSLPPTHKSRRAQTRGKTPPSGHNTPWAADITPLTGSSAAWTLAHPYTTLFPPPTKMGQIGALICEILPAAAEDGKFLPQTSRPIRDHTGAPLQADTYIDTTDSSSAPQPPTLPQPMPLPPRSPRSGSDTPTVARSPGPHNGGLFQPPDHPARPPQTLSPNALHRPHTR